MGLFNSRSAAATSSWLLLSLALLILHVQAQRRYIPRRHHIRRISHPNSKIQSVSPSLLHPISVPLLPGPILKIPPPPKKFAYATFAPIPSVEDPDDPLTGFIQLVLAKQPLYPPAPYQKPTNAPTTAAPKTEVPTTVPPPTTVKPKTLKPYVRPAPITSKTYVRPPPTDKAIIPKIVKPTKNPLNAIPKVTKATPAPTSSAAPPPVDPVLDQIVDVRVVGGEMMKLGVTKTQETDSPRVPHTSDVTAPANIETAAPSTVPPATTSTPPISTKAPATESLPIETESPKEVLRGNTPVPLSFASFSPYQRPFYRPAIYTRPPFRQHLQYTLLPKSTEAPATSEIDKLNVEERLSVPTTTEVEPEIVTLKEEVPVPAQFDDYEMFKVLPDDSEENSISEIDEEPTLSGTPELPPVLSEEPVIFEDPEKPIIVEVDLKDNEIIETVPEEPNIFEVISNEPEIIEVIPDEPTIVEDIPDEPTIFESIPEEPEIIESIPAERIVVDVVDVVNVVPVPNEPKIVETIPEVPAIIEDVPKELEVLDPELVEPQIVEEEKKLPVNNKISAFDFIIPETANDIQLSTEETETDEEDFEIGPIFEDITEAVPVAAEEFKIIQEGSKPDLVAHENPETLKVFEPEEFKIIQEGSKPDLVAPENPETLKVFEPIPALEAVPVAAEEFKIIQEGSKPNFVAPENPETLKVFEPIPALEEEIVEESPIINLPEIQEIVTTVETQPFKRSHKYEPVWNIHTFSHGDKQSPPRSQSFPGWPELSSTTRKSRDYPTWLQSTTSLPLARNIPDWPQHVTTHRGYVFSKWSPKTIESTTKKSSEEIPRLNRLKNGKPRRRFRTSTVKPTTRRGTFPTTSPFIKSTTVKTPGRSTIFPPWEEIQTRKASRERTSSESRETNLGLNAGFGTVVGTGFGFGDWGSKI